MRDAGYLWSDAEPSLRVRILVTLVATLVVALVSTLFSYHHHEPATPHGADLGAHSARAVTRA